MERRRAQIVRELSAARRRTTSQPH
jgi:hypothetical protein